MGKIARIVSIEFESAEARRSTQKKFREVMSELASGLELIAVVNTDETSAMTIQIWPNQETLDAFEQKMIDWVEKTCRCTSATGLPMRAISIFGFSRSNIPVVTRARRVALALNHSSRPAAITTVTFLGSGAKFCSNLLAWRQSSPERAGRPPRAPLSGT